MNTFASCKFPAEQARNSGVKQHLSRQRQPRFNQKPEGCRPALLRKLLQNYLDSLNTHTEPPCSR